MIKKIFLITILLVAAFNFFGQSFPGIGVAKPEHLQMRECPFDKEAIAVVLVEEARSNYNDYYNLVTEHHVQIKILKENGINLANVVLPFWRMEGVVAIDQIEACVINTTASGHPVVEKLDRKSFFTQNIDDKRGEVKFTFPQVKVGSIIEYKYRYTMKHYGYLDDWYFQKEIPVIQSKYHLTIIPNFQFAYQVQKKSDFKINITPNSQDGSIEFEMRDIPGLEDEAYMDAPRDYLQRVTFQLSQSGNGMGRRKYMTSWDEVARELLRESAFGSQLGKEIPGTADFVKLVKENPVLDTRIKLVYNYVRSVMQWNGYYGKYSSDGVKQAWNKKTGNCAEVNFVLVNLLREAGLEADPILVSERQHGRVNTEYPFIDQFNAVYAFVKANNKNYFLDATDKSTPYNIIPLSILNTTAFVVNRKNGGLLQVNDESLFYNDNIYLSATIDETKITGDVNLNSKDYARVNHLYQFKKNKEKYIDISFRKMSDILIDDFVMSNQENDSLELKQKFRFTTQVNTTGDYKFIPLNIFTGLETNPFVSNKRFTNVNFGYKKTISYTAHYDITGSWIVDALPKSIKLVTSDNSISFTREVLFDESSKKIMARFKLHSLRSLYSADEYPALKEFYKKLFDLLNEQIVLKKKATP